MTWEVVEFLVWLGKQEGCILAGCNAVIEKSDWVLQQKRKGSEEERSGQERRKGN